MCRDFREAADLSPEGACIDGGASVIWNLIRVDGLVRRRIGDRRLELPGQGTGLPVPVLLGRESSCNGLLPTVMAHS